MALPTTTMDSLKDDNVEEILLRLPSWASLGHTVRASHRFRHIASSPDFLRRFRARHASSSPRSLLGVFAQRYSGGFPVFHVAGPARSDPGLVAVARSGDFLLAGLEDDPAWRLHNCRNGRLLLSKGTSLTIYDPISLCRTDISRPQDDLFLNGYISTINCLLDDGGAPFRIVSLQVDDRCRLRAVEYDSRVEEWRFHPWAAAAITPPHAVYPTMYAAGLIFWKRDGSAGASSLLLDTRTMEFSMLRLPATIVGAYLLSSRYSIGDTEDGKYCLVCVSNQVMQVWLLKENRGGGSKWEFEKETPLREVLAGRYCNQHHVGEVVAGPGLVILCSGNVGDCNSFHDYVIDLKDLSLKAVFSHLGAATAYPFQLRWPPAGLSPAKRRMLQITDIKAMHVGLNFQFGLQLIFQE